MLTNKIIKTSWKKVLADLFFLRSSITTCMHFFTCFGVRLDLYKLCFLVIFIMCVHRPDGVIKVSDAVETKFQCTDL